MTTPIDTASVEIVPDFGNFTRLLRSGIDSALREMVRQVDAAFEQVERAAGEAGADIGREISSGGEAAEGALREVARQADRSFRQVSTEAGHAASALRTKLATAAQFAGLAIAAIGVAAAAGLGALAGFGLKAAANLEQTQIGFEALLGSAEQAESFLKEVQQFAAATPFEFQGIADASRRILAFGTSVGIARDEVLPTLETIGSLVSVLGGTQESIDSVVRAFGQMASKGKISQEELLQLAEALPGFNANAAIAAALGVDVATAMEMITAGEVDAKTGIDALLAGMANFPGAAGAMAKQAETLMGVFSTFKDTVSIALTEAFKPVIPEIKDTLKEITPVIEQAVKILAPALGELLSSLGPILADGLSVAAPILAQLVNLLGTLLRTLAPSLGPLAAAFGEISAALGPLVNMLGQVLAEAIVALVPALLELVPIIKELSPSLIQLLIAVMPLIPPLGELLAAVVALLVPVAEFLAWAIEMEAQSGKFRVMADLINLLTGAVRALGQWLSNINWSGIWNAIVGVFSSATRGVQMALENMSGFVRWHINNIIGVVRSLPGAILSAIGNLGGLLFNAGRDVILGLWNGISSLGGWIWGQIRSFVRNNIIDAAKNILDAHSPSKVFADEVGEAIPAGIMKGVNAGMADLQGLLSPILPSNMNGGGSSSVTNMGGINVSVVFSGVVPSADEARRTGDNVARGISEALARRNVGFGVRMAGAGV